MQLITFVSLFQFTATTSSSSSTTRVTNKSLKSSQSAIRDRATAISCDIETIWDEHYLKELVSAK